MLGPGRYLLGVVELLWLAGFAWAGADAVRRRLLREVDGGAGGLATAVLALAVLIWCAEALGTVSLFEPVPYLVAVAVVGAGLRLILPPRRRMGAGGGVLTVAGVVALVIAAVAAVHFAGGVKTRLGTGMTGFDSTWYHGPFAAGFHQSGNTLDLHFIAPQFLAWFYPANGEIFHAIGMGAFGRDLISPLLNLGWFAGCLVACWCIGRPYRVGPWSLGLGAVALSVPALADQAGEARNDIVGIFFLLAAVAIALNASPAGREGKGRLSTGATLFVGLAAGLAAGTKLNFLLPAAVLVVGVGFVQAWSAIPAPSAADEPGAAGGGGFGRRWRAGWKGGGEAALAALAGGGYWYLRNLVHSGNPLPWIHHLGPIDLPAPDQALGGREAHSVLGYLTDGAVWSDWFLPGLHSALWFLWPLLGAAALAGLLLAVAAPLSSRGSLRPSDGQKEPRDSEGGDGGRFDPALVVVGAVGLATALAWLVAPTSASGPDGMPRGFESGIRYLAPALVLGLALVPVAPVLRRRLAALGARPIPAWSRFHVLSTGNLYRDGGQWGLAAVGIAALLAVVAVGYPVQRYYLDHRYADPSFTTPGLNAAFAWADDVSDARIATTSTRQYPLFGTDLSNHVQFIGEETPHGGFEPPTDCRRWRELLNAGHYDYVITTRDRIEPGKPPYPPEARWTEAPSSHAVLRKPPTVVFKLNGSLDPSGCP